MSYYQSAQGQTISLARAILELQRHGMSGWQDAKQFYADLGLRDWYTAQEVLAWLGY